MNVDVMEKSSESNALPVPGSSKSAPTSVEAPPILFTPLKASMPSTPLPLEEQLDVRVGEEGVEAELPFNMCQVALNQPPWLRQWSMKQKMSSAMMSKKEVNAEEEVVFEGNDNKANLDVNVNVKEDGVEGKVFLSCVVKRSEVFVPIDAPATRKLLIKSL